MKRSQMKINTLICLIVALMNCFLVVKAKPIDPEKVAPLYYIVNLDKKLQNVFFQPNVDSKLDSYNNSNETSSLADSLYTMSNLAFKNDLGFELLPLNDFEDKASESVNCPEMINIKKVLKTSSGYNYYVDYYVNIFSGNNIDSVSRPSLNQIRPLYVISLTLYDNGRNVVNRIQYVYRSSKPLAEKLNGTKRTEQDIKMALCDIYQDALKEFAFEFNNKKAETFKGQLASR
jgi:hypothetical protein